DEGGENQDAVVLGGRRQPGGGAGEQVVAVPPVAEDAERAEHRQQHEDGEGRVRRDQGGIADVEEGAGQERRRQEAVDGGGEPPAQDVDEADGGRAQRGVERPTEEEERQRVGVEKRSQVAPLPQEAELVPDPERELIDGEDEVPEDARQEERA